MKFPKAQPKPLSPCDDCLVTIRSDKGPAVRFGNSGLLPEARTYNPDEVVEIIEREGGFNFGFNRETRQSNFVNHPTKIITIEKGIASQFKRSG